MGPIRVFAGIPLPVETRLALSDRIDGLDIPGRVAPMANWHITLRFLGKVDQVAFERFLAGLHDVEEEQVFTIDLSGFGAFPNSKRASVVWLGVREGEEPLMRLNQIAEEAAVGAGLAGEDRPFHPHLTLSRVRPPAGIRHLIDEDVAVRWACDRVVVFQSHLGGGPARYEPLETFLLSR